MQNSVIDTHIANYSLSSDVSNISLIINHLNISDYYSKILSTYSLEIIDTGRLQYKEINEIKGMIASSIAVY